MALQLSKEEYDRIDKIVTDAKEAFHNSTKAFLTSIGVVNAFTPYETWERQAHGSLNDTYREQYGENPLFIAMITAQVAYETLFPGQYEDTIEGVTEDMLEKYYKIQRNILRQAQRARNAERYTRSPLSFNHGGGKRRKLSKKVRKTRRRKARR